MADIRFIVSVDSSGAVASIKALDQALQNVSSTTGDTQKSSDNLSSALAGLWPQFTIGSLAASAITKGLSAIQSALNSIIPASIAAQSSQVGLAASLDLTGRKGEGVADSLMTFARAQQESTVYTHVAVENVMALLSQLTQLDAQGIQRATRGIIGLSAVLGKDLQTSALMVARAMEGNYMSLQRVGIITDANLPAAERQNQLLEKLEELYPRATAEAATFGGSMTQIKNEVKAATEKLGEQVTKAQAWLDIARSIKGLIADITSSKPSKAAGGMAVFGVTPSASQMVRDFETTAANAAKASAILSQAFKDLEAGATYDFSAIGDAIRTCARPSVTFLDSLFQSVLKGEPAIRTSADVMRDYGVELFDVRAKVAQLTADQPILSAALRAGNISFNEYTLAMAHNKEELDKLTPGYQRLIETGLSPISKNLERVKAVWEDLNGVLAETPLDDVSQHLYRVQYVLQDLYKDVDATQLSWKRAIDSMLAAVTRFGDGSESVFKTFAHTLSDTCKTMMSAYEDMTLKQLLLQHQQIAGNQAVAESGVLAKVFETIPFPFDLIAAAVAFAAVNALFAKVLKFGSGFEGVISKPTPILVGEVGPEYVSVTPMRGGTQTTPANAGGRGGTTISININSPLVVTSGLADSDIERAGTKLFQVVRAEARRYGRTM